MISVSEIAERLNDQAATLAAELLPNGRRAGAKWMASGIADTGRSESLYVHLSGPKIGHWFDMGNAAPGEDKGDMLDLIRLKFGLDAAGAVDEAKRRLGIHDDFTPGARHRPNREEMERRAADARERAERRASSELAEKTRKAKGAKALYLSAGPIAGTGAELYLRGRAIEAPGGRWPGSLRFHAAVSCFDTKDKRPAMLGCVVNAEGEQMGTHRTYLQLANGVWGKLQVPRPKKILGNMWGGFVPIAKGASAKSMRDMPEGEPVYVTEGIEDALCVAMMKPDARVICAISVPNFGGLVLPAAARRIVIVADRDDNETAQGQLERAIAQQQARGLRVELVMPPAPHKDINDWWRAIRRETAA
jgi:hypothetical protein